MKTTPYATTERNAAYRGVAVHTLTGAAPSYLSREPFFLHLKVTTVVVWIQSQCMLSVLNVYDSRARGRIVVGAPYLPSLPVVNNENPCGFLKHGHVDIGEEGGVLQFSVLNGAVEGERMG